MKLTLKAAKLELGKHNISIHKIEGEYKVYPKGTIGQAYFTDDLQDAYGTGLMMGANTKQEFEQAASERVRETPTVVSVAVEQIQSATGITVAIAAPVMSIQQFVEALNLKFNPTYTFGTNEPGPKYTRVVISTPGHRAVFCFVDAQGNIYKADGWKRPAKGVRATLATVDINRVDPYGSWLYR